MTKPEKLLQRIFQGTSDANIPLAGLCRLLDRLGFVKRVHGDHHIFTREGVEEILNLQPAGGTGILPVLATLCEHGLRAKGLPRRQSDGAHWSTQG